MSARRVTLPAELYEHVKSVALPREPATRAHGRIVERFVRDAVEVALYEAARIAARRGDYRRSTAWARVNDAKVTGAEWECEGCGRPRSGPGVERCVPCAAQLHAIRTATDTDVLRDRTPAPPVPNAGDNVWAGTKHGSAPSRRQVVPPGL